MTGNDGNNVVTGGSGNDILNGRSSEDTAVYAGDSSEYKISTNGNKTTVADTIAGRDGKDELTDIEVLQFKDKKVKV